jgi:5-methylcytosine-specific restriction endonuclease McrA
MVVTRKEFARHSRPVLKTRRWKVLRQIILERDGYACTCCGTRRGRLEIDHVKPVRDRPDLAFAPANLATLCPRCHAAKTRIECGHKPTDPARLDWRKAVADLATVNPPSKGHDHA